METIRRVTGQKPIGWNTYWLRCFLHILDTLWSVRPRAVRYALHSTDRQRADPHFARLWDDSRREKESPPLSLHAKNWRRKP
jgi:hypothetical protein